MVKSILNSNNYDLEKIFPGSIIVAGCNVSGSSAYYCAHYKGDLFYISRQYKLICLKDGTVRHIHMREETSDMMGACYRKFDGIEFFRCDYLSELVLKAASLYKWDYIPIHLGKCFNALSYLRLIPIRELIWPEDTEACMPDADRW